MIETTLAQALSASGQSITLTDAGDLVQGDLLALDAEFCRILKVLTPTQALVQRGVNGTPSSAHAAGVTVSISVPEDFLTGPQLYPAFGIEADILTGLGPSAAATFQANAGGAPVSATYLTLSTNATLTHERVLTAGTNISFVDAGAGSTLTINATGGGGGLTFPDLATPPADTFLGDINAGTSFAALSLSGGEVFADGDLYGVIGQIVGTDVAGQSIASVQMSQLTLAGTATQNVQTMTGLLFDGNSRLPTGRTLAINEGVHASVENTGAGTTTRTRAFFAQTNNAGAGATTTALVLDGWLYADAGTIGTYRGVSLTNGGTGAAVTTMDGIWVDAFGGFATNVYPFWADEQGVFRIKADNTFDAVYQAIPALYNPQVTKYTPGAANYERIVWQWESNVGTLTTEKGGTGTLRALNVGDAGVQVQINGKNITLSGNLTTTGAFHPTFAIPSSSTWTFPSGGGTLVASTGAVTSVAGTANQITASAATGAVTLSIPTNPVFSGTAVTFPGLLSIASAKTLTASNSLTLAGTDSTTMTFPTTSATIARTDAANTFTGVQTMTSPALTTPAIATGAVITEAVGTSALVLTGNTQVTSFPVLSATQTWNASGTTFEGAVINITATAKAAASTLFVVKSSGVSQFQVRQDGYIFTSQGIQSGNDGFYVGSGGPNGFFGSPGAIVRSDATLGWGSSTNVSNQTFDTFLKRGGAAATVQHGADVNGAAVNQTIQACNGITGNDKTGANFAINSGKGTGAGAVSSITLGTPTALGSGGTAQSITTRLTVDVNGLTLADAANLVVNATTGTKIGTATSQKLGFWNATPIIQPAGAGQAAYTDSTGGVAAASLVDVTTAAVSDPVKVNANFATIAVLALAMRTAMVNAGIMKGAA